MSIKIEHNDSDFILVDDERKLTLVLSGWDDGSLMYYFRRGSEDYTFSMNELIEHGDCLDEEDLRDLVFITVYNRLLERHNLS